MRTYLLMFSIVALGGCGLTLDETLSDGGGAGPDAGSADSGSGSSDAGERDGSLGMDADLPGDDAGPFDAGPFDAGPFDADSPDAAGCADFDGDGMTDCAGDCDDLDPTAYLGAPLICGDGVDNDCDGVPDVSACLGIGTYVAPGGSNTNPGTQSEPVRTVAQGLLHANRIGRGVDVYVAQGHYDVNLTMVESHSILCGYDPSTWDRDPSSFPSELRPTNAAGVVFPSGVTNLTELDGCTVRGLGEQTTSAAITFELGGSGVVRNNRVIGPDNPSGASVGIAVYPLGALDAAVANPGTPLIEGNLVEMGRSRAGWSRGTSTSLGLWSSRTMIVFDGNTVMLTEARTIQRAIELRNSLPGSQVINNEVRSAGGRSEHTYGLRVLGGSVSVSHNDVQAGACEGWCLAVEIGGSIEFATFTNNLFFGGDSTGNISAGVLFSFEGTPTGALDVLLHSNLIIGGASGSPSIGVGWWGEGTRTFAIGRVMNNIVYAGRGVASYAMWERGATLDPELIEANALYVPSGSGGSAAAGLYFDEGGSLLSRMTGVNSLPEHSGVPNRVDNCAVNDPRPGGDPHLSPSSSCIDRGTTSEAPPIDWDGDPRPMGRGTDIGVDETP